MARKVATPWGQATVLEEVVVRQRAGDRRFATVVQLLADVRGAPLVRFAYTTDGIARRGPVTLRSADVAALVDALADGKHPGLAAALGFG